MTLQTTPADPVRDHVAAHILGAIARHDGSGGRAHRIAGGVAFLGVDIPATPTLDTVLVGDAPDIQRKAVLDAAQFAASTAGLRLCVDPEESAQVGPGDLVLLTRHLPEVAEGHAATPDVSRAGGIVVHIPDLATDITLNDARQAKVFNHLNYRPALPARAVILGGACLTQPDAMTVTGLNAACQGMSYFILMPRAGSAPHPCAAAPVAVRRRWP